jgi:hypothetical protein
MRLTTKKKQQAKVLSVKQVSTLESLVTNAPELPDRVMAGHCLYNLYARCRWSDTQHIERLITDIQPDGSGFAEGHTYYTKTSNTVDKQRMFLPITAVTDGLVNHNWYNDWLLARAEAELPEPNRTEPLMPVIDHAGKFGHTPISPSLASQWLRDLLILGGHSRESVVGISSHSLKSTCLSWVAKAGVCREHRQVLGYHMVQGSQSALHYSRDEQAEPLRQLAHVIHNIRIGNFDPDSSRSGYWKQQQALESFVQPRPKVKAADSAKPPNTVLPTEHGLESEDSSSSEATRSEDLSDEERALKSKDTSDEPAKKKRAAGSSTEAFCVHTRWRTLHTVHSTDENKLSCGRPITKLYRRVVETPSFDFFRCQVCFGQV